jgi:uncharacterized protein (DUF433 family)
MDRLPHRGSKSRKQGGAPLIKGTRAPVSAILNNHASGSSDEEIAENFGIPADRVRIVPNFAAKMQSPRVSPLKIFFDQNVPRNPHRHLSLTTGHTTRKYFPVRNPNHPNPLTSPLAGGPAKTF